MEVEQLGKGVIKGGMMVMSKRLEVSVQPPLEEITFIFWLFNNVFVV